MWVSHTASSIACLAAAAKEISLTFSRMAVIDLPVGGISGWGGPGDDYW